MSKKETPSQVLAYYALKTFTTPLSLLSYPLMHGLGRAMGTLAYTFSPPRLKKITFNNLALAKSLNLSEREIKKIARHSYQNLVVNALLYFRLKRSRGKITKLVTGHNLEPFHHLLDQGQGVIAVTGHISNWELCFLHHTQFRKGYAIGKPIKNKRIYRFIQSIREMHKGHVIEMQNALTEGAKVLKQGHVFSMVNDQSFTSSPYAYPFFGVRAWTSPSPALLAYRTNCPIVVVTTVRQKGSKYDYFVSDPIWPNRKNRLKQELPRIMDLIMEKFEKHISKYPDQWLWQHKRWKQEGFHRVYPEYKADSILFILPKDPELFKKIAPGLKVLKQIYRRSFLTFLIPQEYAQGFDLKEHETLTYKNDTELYRRDYRFQLVFDLMSQKKLQKHYLKLGAWRAFSLVDLLSKLGQKPEDPFVMREIFIQVLCLPGTPFS